MPRLARAEVFSPDIVATVHVMARVVRRCFLLGTDSVTGKNYDHRKVWIEEQLIRLAAHFGIDLAEVHTSVATASVAATKAFWPCRPWNICKFSTGQHGLRSQISEARHHPKRRRCWSGLVSTRPSSVCKSGSSASCSATWPASQNR